MHAPTETAAGTASALTACETCGTENVVAARFCKQCGSALSPPPVCPSCRAAVPKDARFCSSCGVKLVGTRPGLAPQPGAASAAEPKGAESQRASPVERPRENPIGLEPAAKDEPTIATRVAGSAQVEMLAASAPRRRSPSSSIVANVLMFVAVLAVILVAIYVLNQDAPKTVSPFQGPPAAEQLAPRAPGIAEPGQAALAKPAEGAATGAAESPIRGVVKIDPSLTAGAPSGGTVFIIARMAGMPDRGPPIAVKKIDRPSFPLAFELGPSDVMMKGVPFNGPFDLYVRLDADGNAMTKQPGDLQTSAPKPGVMPGAGGVEIVLDKRL